MLEDIHRDVVRLMMRVSPFAGANVVVASEIHAEIESLVQCLERTTKCHLYNILPMLKFKLFAIEIKDEQANC